MATPNVVTKTTLAFIDFQFVVLNHKHITQNLVSQSIIGAMKNRLSIVNLEFNENELKITEFTEKGKMRRVSGWFSCTERDRDKYLIALQKVMTDKTVSKIISTKSNVKATKIKIGQLMIKFSNDFDVEMPSFDNTQNIPDKYLKTESFRSKSANYQQQETK